MSTAKVLSLTIIGIGAFVGTSLIFHVSIVAPLAIALIIMGTVAVLTPMLRL